MANLYGPRIVTDGLVLHIDAANRKSYPGTGTSWYDLSGNGGYAVLTNGPTFTSEAGGSILFDEINDYARITRSDLNAGSFAYGNITCEIWLRPTGGTGDTGNNIITVENCFELSTGYLSNGYYSLFQASNPWAWYGTTSNPLVGDTWNQIIFTHSNTTSSLYANTTQVHTRSNSGALQSPSSAYPYLTLMGRYSGTTNNCRGYLSVVKIYNRVLSSSEITQNYNAFKGRFGL